MLYSSHDENNFTFDIVTLKDGFVDSILKTVSSYNFMVDRQGKHVCDPRKYAIDETRKMIDGLSKILVDDTLVLVEFKDFC